MHRHPSILDYLRASNGPELITLGEYTDLRRICNRVKTGDLPDIREAASMMAASAHLPLDGALIPMPSHNGRAEDTYLLCQELSRLTGLPVMDILCGAPRESLHSLKTAGAPLPSADYLQLRLMREVPASLTPLLVDNVIGTGLTMDAALALIPNGLPCTLAIDSRECHAWLSRRTAGQLTPITDAKVFPSFRGR